MSDLSPHFTNDDSSRLYAELENESLELMEFSRKFGDIKIEDNFFGELTPDEFDLENLPDIDDSELDSYKLLAEINDISHKVFTISTEIESVQQKILQNLADCRATVKRLHIQTDMESPTFSYSYKTEPSDTIDI